MAIIQLPVEDTPEYQRQIVRLSAQEPVATDFWAVGQDHTGSWFIHPNSLRAGYQDALRPWSQRRSLAWDFGIIGGLTDGTLVFPPTYRAGLTRGGSLANELRFSILADRSRAQEAQIDQLKSQVDELRRIVRSSSDQDDKSAGS